MSGGVRAAPAPRPEKLPSIQRAPDQGAAPVSSYRRPRRGEPPGNETVRWLLGGVDGGPPVHDRPIETGYGDVVAAARADRSGGAPAGTAAHVQRKREPAQAAAGPHAGAAVLDDRALEREADRVAARVEHGACSRCEPHAGGPGAGTAAAGAVQRAAVTAAPGSGTVAAPVPASSGSPLAAAVRQRIEPVLGVDLAHVRVHSDEPAQRAARAVQARAFTSGPNIWLGPRERADDVALLAHEATHVVQQGAAGAVARPYGAAVVQRQPDGRGTGSSSQTPSPPSTPAASPADVQTDAGPCAVDAAALTNEGLLFQLNRARAYLSQHERGQGQFYDHANLFRSLSRERRARVENGHVWLAEPGLLHVPEMLYGLEPAGQLRIAVVEVASAQLAGPKPVGISTVVTRDQLNRFLALHNIPVVDPRDYFARQSPATRQPMTIALPDKPAAPPPPAPLPPSPWSGLIGDKPVFMLWSPDIMSVLRGPHSAEEMFGMPPDLKARFDQPISASESLRMLNNHPGDVVSSGPELVCLPSLDYTTRPPAALTGSPLALPPNPLQPPGFPMTGASALSYLGEPGPPLPSSATGIMWEGSHTTDITVVDGQLVTGGFRSSMARHLVSDLERGMFQGGGPALRSLNRGVPGSYANDALFPYFRGAVAIYRMDGTPVDAAEVLRLMVAAEKQLKGEPYRYSTPPRTGSGAAAYDKAFGNEPPGFCPPGGQNCINAPVEVHNRALGGDHLVLPGENGEVIPLAAPENASAANMRRFLALPESFFTERGLVRVPIGNRMLAGAGFAGVLGAGAAVAGDALSSQPAPHYVRDAAIGFGGGTTTVFAENYASNALTRRLAASGLGATSASRLGRLGGGTGVAVAAAPLITGLTMAFDDQKYTSIDYAARMGRSSVAAGGGAVAAGLTGAAMGSEFPIIGNIIGFLVGVGAYYVVDRLVGDKVEEEIRMALGEGGCTKGVGPGK